MAKSNKNYVGVVALFIVLVGVVLAIVGVCIDWIQAKALEDTLLESTNNLKLKEWLENIDNIKKIYPDLAAHFNAMASFAILTVIISGGTLVLAGIAKLLGWKLIKLLLFIAAIAAIVCAVITIITSFTFSGELADMSGGSELIKYSPAVGAWLTTVGGVLAGIAGLGVAMKA